jgi:Bifunctional DNA primase/polymerase, N-terminal
MPDMLAAALDFAQRGIPVFPVSAKNKKPLTANGFKDATTDEAKVRAWWAKRPKAMIGIPMGPPSKMWLFDVDVNPTKGFNGPKELAQLTAQHGPLPKTLMSSTPRGGSHFYFRWNGVNIRNSTSKIARGLDVRGNGGYAIVPPSTRTDGRAYSWCGNVTEPVEAPQWLIDEAVKATRPKKARQTATPSQKAQKSSPRDKAWARKALEDECAAVAAAPPGTRNDRLNIAAYNLFQIVANGELDEQEVRDRLFKAAEDCGLVADDGAQQVWATINSGATAGSAQPRSRPQPGVGPQPAPQPQPQPQPGAAPQPQPRPTQARVLSVIRLIEGRLPKAVDEAETALLAANCHIYQRGDLIVRPIKPKLKAASNRDTFGWQLVPLNKHFLVDTFTRIARFEKWNAKAGDYVPKNCPDQIAEVYLSRAGRWKIPILLGIVNTPFLRMDGSLCERPGYDQASALLFRPERQSFPSIPIAPTLEEARTALQFLDDVLLAEFPFVQNIDCAVALSAILTAFDRRAMATAPLHAFSSPIAGTGKSLLVDIASILTTGELAPVISQGKTEEEMEKRLGAALISGDQIISLDNCDRELSSAFLCQALTQQRLKIRLLGYSRHVDTPITSTFFATGNNLEISNDLTRRTLLCRMDAGVERPETRRFKSNVLEVARDKRGALVAAILTVLRAWHHGATAIGAEPLGGFEAWSFRVRSPILWLDYEDPCASITTVRASDPHREVLNTVLVQWEENLGTANSFTIQEVIARAINDRDFFGALAAVAISKQSGSISNDRLGRWLNKNDGKIVNKLKLSKMGIKAGYPLWQVSSV